VVCQEKLDSHKEEKEFHDKRIKILQEQYNRLQHRLDQIYIDKIDGKITDEFYEEKADLWEEERKEILRQIEKHQNSNANYFAQGIHILELCNKAHRLYLQQTPLKRAKLLHYILSNCILDNATLCPTYRKPFDLIAKGLSRSNWLPELDARRNSYPQEIHLVVKMTVRRYKGGFIKLT